MSRQSYDVGALLSSLADDGDIGNEEECWNWPGSKDSDGYGVKRYEGRQWRVPRLAYKLSRGEDPGPMLVLHSCDNRACFRPSHLSLGTHKNNAEDKVARGRCRNQYNDASHCIYGHEFSAENTYINPSSASRQCRTCRYQFAAFDRRLSKASPSTRGVLKDVFRERLRQDFRFDEQNYEVVSPEVQSHLSLFVDSARDKCDAAAKEGTLTWYHILSEEWLEAIAETDPVKRRMELVQLAAVVVAAIESEDRKASK